MSNEIDTEKIRELNESLRELTGTVTVAEQAVEKIVLRLGFGDKLKKETDKRIDAEQEATSSIKKTTTLREDELKKQNDIFKKELDYRKVQLDANGELISTAVRLTKEQRETIRLADLINQKDRQRMAALDSPGKAMTDLAGKVNSAEGIMGVFNDKILSLTSSSAGATAGFIAVKAVMGGLADAAGIMTKSLYEGERGAIVGAKAVTALASQLETAAYTIGAALMFIPGFGIAARVAGAAISLLGYAAKKAAEANEIAAKQNDTLFKSFNTLSQAGLTTAEGMTEVFDQMQTLGMTVAEMEKFNTLLKTNSKDLKLFGTTAADGAKNFANIAGALYKSDLGEKLELLGVNADEQREHTLRYMAQQTRMGLSLGKSQEQQIQGAKAYIEELDRLAMLTGTNRKEQEEAREAMLKIEDLRAAQFEAEQRNDTKRAEELERYAKAAAAIYKFDPRGAKGLAEFGAAGGPTGADSSAAMLTYGKGINAIKQGKSTEEIMMAMSESAKAMLKTTSTTRRIGGDISGMLTGKFGDIKDFTSSMDAAKKLVGEGKAANITEALNKIQKDKEAGLDPDTKNNVEAGRKQQAAAMTMDSVVKSFNISSKINLEASNVFEKAVATFADTVGAKKPAGGVPSTSGTPPVTTGVPEAKITDAARKTERQALKDFKDASKTFGSGSDEANAAKEAAGKAKAEAERAQAKEEKARREVSPTGPGTVMPSMAEQRRTRSLQEKSAKPDDKAKEPVTIPAKEKHSAASLKAMGLPLKQGDVQGEGKELDTRLVDIAKKAKDNIPGFTTITAFNDNFHSQPGRSKSLHTEGKAFDFKLNYKPTVEQGKEVVKMLKDMGAGYALDEYNFPSPGSTGGHFHAQLAQDGGEFSGPKSGYPVLLHDKEIVLNKIQSDKLKQKLEQVEKKPVDSAIPGLSTTSSTNPNANTEVVAMLKQFTDVMEYKMDSMIDVLNNGNDISGKILTYSMA